MSTRRKLASNSIGLQGLDSPPIATRKFSMEPSDSPLWDLYGAIDHATRWPLAPVGHGLWQGCSDMHPSSMNTTFVGMVTVVWCMILTSRLSVWVDISLVMLWMVQSMRTRSPSRVHAHPPLLDQWTLVIPQWAFDSFSVLSRLVVMSMGRGEASYNDSGLDVLLKYWQASRWKPLGPTIVGCT